MGVCVFVYTHTKIIYSTGCSHLPTANLMNPWRYTSTPPYVFMAHTETLQLQDRDHWWALLTAITKLEIP